MNDSTIENKKVYTEEQSDLLEVTYEVIYDELRKALSLVNITREGLINVHGEFNKKIEAHDIDCTLRTIQELINPVVTEICEASCSADYFFRDKENKNKYTLWDTVDEVLKIVHKRRSDKEKRS